MTRTRIVGGKIIETTGGNYNIYTKESIVYSAATTITETGVEKGVSYGSPQAPPKRDQYFVKGWWSLDFEGEKIISRAIVGMRVYFHLETKNIPNGDSVFLTLFDEDNKEKEDDGMQFSNKDKDDKIKLVIDKKEYKTEVVQNNKLVSKINLTSDLSSFSNLEDDKLLELYFRCSYKNENNQFPKKKEDYLKVGQLVIDRFKMPGLNVDGSSIADDMTFGFGIKNATIYSASQINSYIKEYTLEGFNKSKHQLFSNESSSSSKSIYSKSEIENLGMLMKMTSNVENEDHLWIDFNLMTGALSKGTLDDNIKLMIAKFKANTGGVYENENLRKAVLENPSTISYLAEVDKYIVTELKKKVLILDELEDKEPYFGKTVGDIFVYSNKEKGDRKSGGKSKFNRPAFSWKSNWNVLRGETIALNDIWATEVILKELKNNGNNYSAKYEVTLWDHFGLDKPDMEKFYSYGAGFRAWFVLQHLHGYKPFLTKIKFEKIITGNF